MARILFSVPPLTGHLNPALAVAEELEKRGHQIAWAVHAKQIRDKLPPRAWVYPLDAEDVDGPSIADPQVRGLESVRLFFEDYTLPIALRMLTPLEAISRSFCPDVMVVDHQLPGAALVARKLGVPWTTLVTTTASILKMSPTVDEWVAQQYMSLQCSYLPKELRVERPDFSPHQVVVFSNETLLGNAHPRVDAPYHFVGPTKGNGRRVVDFPWDWLRSDSRKLLISLGTVSRDRDTRFFEVMMAALAEMPEIQAVMVAPESLAERAPLNVLVRSYVPQLELLDQMDGVICHAGHNTVCEALSRGLPLIVAPIRDDQPVIARQVIDAGAGLSMRHGKVTPAMARSTIEKLFSTPELAANAKRLAQSMLAAPGAVGAANLIAAQASPSVRPVH
ncbi:glycosyltransferase [Stenotrophobium rhamnosiphilum]|uniref:Glycosyltransferase n=1 Tax=Stenotrophobium rhamnosiphilum TaxID=2029166 RepID=A0A2T5MKA6_9GAMM|nr:nucleotide disphospho-sugar-binding domain-containing protein [Stenotrophobium rhamnosiphilum]PTU33011.1 glycosyltransferase [Stenotrophobium rhamnosiphilum]